MVMRITIWRDCYMKKQREEKKKKQNKTSRIFSSIMYDEAETSI